MMPGHCKFNSCWLEEFPWLRQVTKYTAKCTACCKTFDIGNMGLGGVKSHASGIRHKKNIQSCVSQARVDFSQNNQTSNSSTSSSATTSNATATTSSFESLSKTLTSEVIWCLKVVNSHFSYSSCSDAAAVFKIMFPDSDLVKSFSCGSDKCSYLATFGIAPYISSLIKNKVQKSSEFVLLFDESMNRHLQKNQMDVYVRLFDNDCVRTKYIASEFLGHQTADIMHEKLYNLIDEHLNSFGNLIQISMDGPNVNWKIHELLVKDVESKYSSKTLINIGSCGLHVIHNAFRSGCNSSGWSFEDQLSALHYLFKDAPARCDDFTTITQSDSFPLRFCRHRWLENVSVVRRALDILPHVKSYVTAAKSKQVTLPSNKSFAIVADLIKDTLFVPKAQAFMSIAQDIEPFLAKYQTDAPMLPFLCDDLFSMLKNLLSRIVKREVLSAITTPRQLYTKFDLKEKTNFKEVSKIDLGFQANNTILDLVKRKKVSDRDVYAFRSEYRTFIVKIVEKMFEKSPLKYGLVRSLNWLVPDRLDSQPVSCKDALSASLKLLNSAGRVRDTDCDLILRQFQNFLDRAPAMDINFKNFNPGTDRLDTYFHTLFSGRPEYHELWSVYKIVLCLSHGQASVERGFSVNKEMITENQKPESLSARRLIVEYIRDIGGVSKVPITKPLLSYASAARQRYRAYLINEAERQSKGRKLDKRKQAENEMLELKRKRQRLESDIESLSKSANEYADLAEKKEDITLIVKSNAMRKAMDEKKLLLKANEKAISEKEITIKSM